MPVKTIHTCDHCGRVQPQHESTMLCLQVTAHRYQQSGYNSYRQPVPTKNGGELLWCDKCAHDTGLDRIFISKEKQKDPAPTLEDIIREIAEDVLENYNG